MPYSEEHGGGCCGITHVVGFDDYDDYELRSLDRAAPEGVDYKNVRCRNWTHLYEVVLTDEQLQEDNNAWAKALKKRGFKLVTRFQNANSGNICNVFHRCKRLPITARGLPFKW